MAICINCSEEIDWFKFVKADVFTSSLNQRQTVDLVLKCPYCDQEYNDFILVENLQPVGELDAT